MTQRDVALKAINMKASAMEAIINGELTPPARKKTMEFLDKPYEQLKQEIKNGKYKSWKVTKKQR